MNTKKIVLAMGVFDLFHIGHLRYLKFARSQGDYLKVGVLKDEDCMKTKGKLPIINQNQRLEIVRNIACVDFADFQPCSTEYTEDAVRWICDWKVDIVVVGDNWAQTERWKRLTPLLNAHGIEVIFSPTTKGISTTDIIKRIIKLYTNSI